MKTKCIARIKSFKFMLLGIVFLTSIILAKTFMSISFGADDTMILIETSLEKYINYSISDQDRGTLVQYNVKTRIDKGDNEEYVPLKSTVLAINLNQIDGKYPYAVKVITKSTELTNAKTKNFEENYEYDSNTGTITIQASNQNEKGELISTTQPSDKARDEYIIIVYYDTYTEQPEERELAIKVQSTVTLSVNDRQISQENEFKGVVQDNIGELTSVTNEADEIYNGYIKSNMINGTNYDTEYRENVNITVSKKEAQQKIEFKENNFFESVYQNPNGEEITQEFASNGNLVYKSTKIKQEDIKRLLGEHGTIQILDVNENLLATIDENTQFAEDGSIVINYEGEPEAIIIKTSNIETEGILSIENTKAIKSTMQNIDYTKIKTTMEIIGIKEKVITDAEKEITEEEIVFTNDYENTFDIKESNNHVNIDVSNTQWTNEYQNEVIFNVYISSNSAKDNMLKDPTIKIELPSEVEKVILGESSFVYANGLELQEPYLETSENGNIVIAASLIGTQTEYYENTLGLVTNVNISATIILKKDIENTVGNVNLIYTNQYTINEKAEIENRSREIKIASYKEENMVEDNSSINIYANTSLLGSTVENVEGLTVEVIPVRGDIVLKDGDTVYEGEFIKYNIKVTNTSDEKIDNIKVVGTVPEGTIYGELEAEYDIAFGKYEYHYDDTIKEKTIEIGSLEPGKSSTQFYEIKAKDLTVGEESKNITAIIKTYVENTEVANYEINNVINPAEVQMFLASRKNVTEGMRTYALSVSSNIEGEAELKIQLPKEFMLRGITNADGYENGENYEVYDTEVSDDNVLTTKINLTTEGKEYIIIGDIDSLKSDNQTEESKLYLSAVAKVSVNNTVYVSNENRIEYRHENVLISMTSDNEGEEVKYEDEIEYKIEIKNIGEKDSYSEYENVTTVNLKDYLPENVEPVSVTYQNWEIGSITQNEETGEYIINEGYKKVEKTEEINGRSTDEEGNRLPDIDIDLFIPFYETSTITIKCKAGLVEEKTKIENNATVSGDYIFSKTSNTITHTILPYDYEEPSDDPNNPMNPDDPITPNNPEDNNDKYSISGIAWLDKNEDGARQTSEQLLNGITVMLVDSNNSSAIKEKTATDSNGVYSFSGLDEGNYIVVFNYDTDIYSVTEYQKSGVSSILNSDAISKEITLMGVETKVGLTDTISLNASVSNVDIGLIENKICDLKLDKYISKVQVKTTSGIKEYTYDNSQLAKVEIKSKEIQGAIVVVTYKIVVTNEGELPAYATKIVDYIPNGLDFSSDLNKSWTATKSGELTNISIANQSIGSGESVELTLVLTKSMTSNSTGTFTNIAEIGEMTNSLGTRDTDSTPGNEVSTEDDYSKADLIISVSTGAVVYISIILGVLLIIAIVVYLNVKFGIKKITKISLFVTVLIPLVFLQNETVFGATTYSSWSNLPNSVVWNENGVHNVNGNGYSAFKASGYNITGYCAMETFMSSSGDGKSRHLDGDGRYNAVKLDSETINSTLLTFDKVNKDEDVSVVQDGNKLKIGPFQIKGNPTSYKYVITGQNKTYNNPEVSDKTTQNGVTTFYLKIDYTEDNIKYIQITGYRTVEIGSKDYYAAYAYYIPYSDAGTGTTTWTCKKGHTHTDWPITAYYHNYPIQDVMTYNKYMWTEDNTKTENKDKTLTWTIKYGDLEITKQDADDSNVKLKDVEIRVQCNAVNYDETFKTDENGKISIKNLKQGTYTITEISNHYYGYNVLATGSIKVKGGMTNTYALKNTKQTGNLKIEKQDADSGEYLKGVSFKIKKKDENKYIQVNVNNQWQTNCTGIVHLDDMRLVDQEDSATTFITDDNGIIEIRNILKGTYEVEEISVGENFGYEVDDNYITWSYTSVANDNNTGSGNGSIATVTVNRRSSVNTKNPPDYENRNEILTFKNKRKYIKLSGYAWEDIIDPTKAQDRDDIYDPSISKDKRLNNVKVTLYKADGTILAETTTQTITNSKGETEDGAYLFEKIQINDLDRAYIEFEYNGMSYESVEIKIDDEGKVLSNGNKASDASPRDGFNEKYATIQNNEALDTNNQHTYTLEYSYDNNVSTLKYGDESNYKYGYDGQKYPISGINDNFSITASTKDVYPNKLLGQELSIDEILTQGLEEIPNINLGLYEKEQPDLAIDEDVYSLDLEINGYTHTYEYANKYSSQYREGYDIQNAQVRFQSKYDLSYTRAVYASDCQYTGNNPLAATVTYKIEINNSATSLTSKINSFMQYYEADDYQVVRAYAEDNAGTKLQDYTYDNGGIRDVPSSELLENSNWEAIQLNTNLTIPYEKSYYVYVVFKIEDLGKFFYDGTTLLKDKIEINVAVEINSYSTIYEDKIYAGIDKDSNPGSLNMNNYDATKEDDTSWAPSLAITVEGARTISGTVFLDNSEFLVGNPEDTHTGEERNGDGIYQETTEKTISGVTVSLYKASDIKLETDANTGVNQIIGEQYGTINYHDTQNGGTGTDGYFEISDFIPDEYIIVYTWGDNTYIQDGNASKLINVNDYKGTIYAIPDRQYQTDWYKKYDYNTIRYSDAMDDYEQRIAIDDVSSIITNMNSKTPNMVFGIEYADDVATKTGTSKWEDEYKEGEYNKLTFEVENVDFGITERARQEVTIDKRIESVKLTLANGQVILNATYNQEKGGLVVETGTAKTIKRGNDSGRWNNGLLWEELDNELIQGAELEVTYKLEVTNNSERDYNLEKYYLYGLGVLSENDKKDTLIKQKPIGVYDYLDSSLRFDANQQTSSNDFEVIQLENYKENVSESTILENYLKEYVSSSTDHEGVETTIKGFEHYSEEYQEIIKEWTKDSTSIIKSNDSIFSDKIILEIKAFENIELEPGGDNSTKSVSLYTSKLLTNTDEITLDNDIEWTKVESTTQIGRKVTPTSSIVYNKGETVIITPPTGDDQNYLPYIILGITSFILLGVGVVFIKKKVLR